MKYATRGRKKLNFSKVHDWRGFEAVPYLHPDLEMLLMFVGRLGPLTMAYFLARLKPKHVKYPEAKFPIG